MDLRRTPLLSNNDMSTRQPPVRSGRSAAPPEDSLISQIKSRMPIDEEVGRYVALKPAPDGELKGKCCFHDDGEPSLYVNPGQGTYFCHGCGASGNVVTFISAMEGGDYSTTKFEIAERLGLVRPKEQTGPQRLLASTLMKYQSALQSAKNAKAYLSKRGITMETAKTFGMGFCWGNEFTNAPPEIIEEAKKAGLFSASIRARSSSLGSCVSATMAVASSTWKAVTTSSGISRVSVTPSIAKPSAYSSRGSHTVTP